MQVSLFNLAFISFVSLLNFGSFHKDARAMQQLWSSQQEEAIECVSVHPNGTYIALGLIDGPIQVFILLLLFFFYS